MKKLLVSVLLAVLLIPQVAMAAWWNPSSWSIFQKKEAKVQQLEGRIKDLEKKLEETSGKIGTTTKGAGSNQGSVKVEKPIVKKTEKVVPVPVSVEKDVVPVESKTFILPNGAVVDAAGNVVSAAPEQPTQVSIKNDKFTGENYFRENKTCAGLKDVNANQHSFCVSYALNGTSSSDDKQSRLNAVNLKIANLNAKYAVDLAAARKQGSTMAYSEGLMRQISIQYEIDYAALMAEYQLIQYSN